MEIKRWMFDDLGDNVTIIYPDEKIDTYALLESSDLIISYGSTVGVEATYWGKTSVILGRSYYDRLDVVYVPRNRDELISWIKSLPMPKNKDGCLKYGYYMNNYGITYKYYKPTALGEGGFMGINFNKPEGFFSKNMLAFIDKVYKLKSKSKNFIKAISMRF